MVPHNSFCACIASTAYVMTHTQISKHWECIYTPVVASTGSVRTHRIASTGSVPTLHKKTRLTPERVASFFACYGDIPRPLIIIKIIYTFTTKITFLTCLFGNRTLYIHFLCILSLPILMPLEPSPD